MKVKIYNKEIFEDIEVDIDGNVKTIKEIKELMQWGKCPVNHVNALFEFLKSALNHVYKRATYDDFPEKEQKEFLDKIRQNNPD